MKAVVLTYDRNHPFTHHMIETYENKWPNHPFKFVVPFNNHYPTDLKEKYGKKVEFKRTESSIRATVLALLEGVAEDEWIYWAIDDKYLVDINQKAVTTLIKWIENKPNVDIDGLSFARTRYLLSGEALNGKTVKTNGGGKIHQRNDYSQIWLHQFLRAKVLKYLFKNMPEPNSAKQMDELKFEVGLPEEHKLFVTDRNRVVFGESTRRGKLTRNCAESLQKYKIDPPTEIDQINDKKIIGDMRRYRNILFQYDLTRSIIWDR